MNDKGYRVNRDVYDSEHYDQFRRVFEYHDEYRVGGAIIFNAELAYLLIESDVPATNRETDFLETFPGKKYQGAYIDGFNEGVTEFQKHWTIAPDTKYGPKSDHYFNDLRRAYEGNMNGDTAADLFNGRKEPGWLHELNNIPSLVTEKSIKKQGYYAGLVSKYRELELKHDRLRVKPEAVTPATEAKPEFIDTLEKACISDASLRAARGYFINNGYCDKETFCFIKRRGYTLKDLAAAIKTLSIKGYAHELTNEEVFTIIKTSFKAKIGIDTVKQAKADPGLMGAFLKST